MAIPTTVNNTASTPVRVSPTLAVLLGLSVVAHGLVLMVQLDFNAVYAPEHTGMLRVKLATQTTPSDGDEPASTVTTAIADSMAKPKQPAAGQDTILSADADLPRANVLSFEPGKEKVAWQAIDFAMNTGAEKTLPTLKPSTNSVEPPAPAMPASMARHTPVMNTAVAPDTAPDTMTETSLKASLDASLDNPHDSKNPNTNHPPAGERQTLLEDIHRALSRHVDYPLRARRRGWEGEVLLAFNLSQLGLIDNIHVARSSGYSLLDESALNALQKVKGVSWRLYEGRLPMTGLEIPVLYRLTDG